MSSLILRWRLFGVFACVGTATLHPAEKPELSPAEAELAKKFAGVVQWQGIYDVSVIGAASISGGNGYHLESRYEAAGHGTFTLERDEDQGWDPERGVFTWQGQGEARGGGQGVFSEWDQRGNGEEWSQEFRGMVEQERIEFSLWLGRNFASLHPGSQSEAKTPVLRRTGRSVSQGKVTPIETSFAAPIDTWYLGSDEAAAARSWQVVSRGPGVFAFTYEGPTSGRSQKFLVSGAGVTQRSRVILFPVYEELEVEVTIADYAIWRPKGSITEPKKPGNTLVARATLKSKGAKPKAFPEVKAFRFELMDTSREPGVCLNWPLEAKDEDYDLRLATAGTGGELSAREQKLTITDAPEDAERRPYAEATVECFDFGARAELRVICELEDGRELIGLMKSESGEQDIVRLPKMKGPDWIADCWREEKDVVKLAAGDDAEKIDEQKHNGDGFTLYEEYRGWAVNGSHVEGDPKRKDFFVLNLIGADARGGIALFEGLSQLRVHSKLKRSEMSQATRRMNGNHRDAPHRVDQHGVWVKTFTRSALGDNGADTPMTKSGVAGRPGITKGVGILARHDQESIFNQPFNLPARDTIFAYDRAIAHELLHSVGVEHHGSGDYQRILGYVSPRNPFNKVGRPYYAAGVKESPTVVLDEAGHDLATKDYPDYVKLREFTDLAMLERELAEGRAYLARNGVGWNGINTPEQYADIHIELLVIYCFMHLNGIVGVEQGAHSGDQDCVMRYYFAKFYEAAGRKDTLYLATPGTERIGIDICHSGRGTGINAPGHQPQSRYGNAAAGEGDCFSQICPNDAIPPRKVKP